MRTLIGAFPFALAAALLMLFAIACGSGGGKADDTNREISDEELARTVLAPMDFGDDYAGFQPDDENGLLTLEKRADDDFDPETETEELKQFGWASGYSQDYIDSRAAEDQSGVFLIGSNIDLYEDADGAAGHFQDSVAELSDLAGQTSEGFTVENVETFEADVADEAVGFYFDGTVEEEDGSSIHVWAATLAFRHGRLVASIGFGSFQQLLFEKEIKKLADAMDQRIASVLAGEAASDEPANDGSSDDLVSTSPAKVLTASAENFQQDVESLRMELLFNMNVGGFAVDADMDMTFEAPDQMYMTMDITGLGSYEMLMLGTDIYMNMPMQGWVVFSMDDMLGGQGVDELGVDAGSFQDAFGEHSFLDYEAIVGSLGGDVEDLGEEMVDGDTYRHYRATLDFADLAAAFSDAFSVTDDLNLEDASGPLTFDVWVDPEGFLPHSLTASGEFAFGADSMVFDANMRIFDYNEPVELPSAPEDALSFADLLSGMFQ